MRMPVRPLFPVAAGLLLLLGACVSTERETSRPNPTATTDPRATFTPPSGRGQRVTGATVLNTVQATHVFSNPASPDRFVLQLRGPRVLSAQLHLAVLTSGGDTLRQEVIPARVLADPQALTTRDQEISVLKAMNNFFNANRFVTPAVAAAAHQPAGISAADWAAVRADARAVGFDYPAADGTLHRLAYAPKLGRVVLLTE